MGTDGLESVLVGDVFDAVLLVVVSDVLVESVGAQGRGIGSDVMDLAGLLGEDLVLGLVQVMVAVDLVLLDVTDDSPATLSLTVCVLGHNHALGHNGNNNTLDRDGNSNGRSLVLVGTAVSTTIQGRNY